MSRVFSKISEILLMSSKVQADTRLAGKGELEKRSSSSAFISVKMPF